MSDHCDFVISEKGRKLLLVNSYKFCFQKVLKSDLARWICTKKGCNSHVKTLSKENLTLVEVSGGHNHKVEDRSAIARMDVQNNLKMKAVEDVRERPSMVIRNGLKDWGNRNFTRKDVHNFRKAIYRARRRVLPKLQSNIQEAQEELNPALPSASQPPGKRRADETKTSAVPTSSALSRVTSEPNSLECKEECDATSRLWVAKLRKFDEDQKFIAESLVIQVLTKAYFHQLTRETQIADS